MASDEFCANIILIINNICFYLIYSFIKKKKGVCVRLMLFFPLETLKILDKTQF